MGFTVSARALLVWTLTVSCHFHSYVTDGKVG